MTFLNITIIPCNDKKCQISSLDSRLISVTSAICNIALVHMYIDWKNTKSMDDINRGNKKGVIISDVYARQASNFSLYRINSH